LTYGIDLPTVVRGLETAGQVPGRLERIECGQPFGVFVDFAHTPHALAGCLRTLRSLVDGRLICVFGAGGDRDRKKRPLMGRAVEAGADLAVVTSDNPRAEDPQTIIHDLLGGFRQPAAAKVVPDRAEAIHWALAAAEPGDCVLIAGKGHENSQIVGDERIPFDDREVAREWLYQVHPYAEVTN
jgi:UDP-N-acetylmuramoyl-L-alanyl-D-glutamate--2,6-diaminopimelate ligase